MLCVACEKPRCKTSHEDLPSKQALRLHLPTKEHSVRHCRVSEKSTNTKYTHLKLADSCSVKDKTKNKFANVQNRACCVISDSINYLKLLPSTLMPCDADLAQRQVNEIADLGTRDRRVEALFFSFLFSLFLTR